MVRLKPIGRQTVVITGASSGIGLATARELAAAGAQLVVAARNEEALRQLVDEIGAHGGRATYVVADVGNEADVRQIGDTALREFGGFDTWFNNAGVTIFGKAEEVSLADQRRLFDTNYWGTVHGSLTALAHLRLHGGALINMGSILSDRAMPLQGPYNASKHAVKGYTDTLRMELERDGAPVSVTLIKPMTVATPLQEHAANYLPRRPRLPPPAYDPRVVARAVRYAAEHPIRELVIGEAGSLLRLADGLAPGVVDRVMEETLFDLQQDDAPDGPRSCNLHSPGSDGRERGDFSNVLGDSVYTRLSTSAAIRGPVGLGGELLTRMAVLGSRGSRWLYRDR